MGNLGGLVAVLVGLGSAEVAGDDDALPAAGLVAVRVRLGARVGIDDLDALDDHLVVVVVAEVGEATGPLDGSLGRGGGSSDPAADLDLHGSLRVAGSALGLGVGEGADDGAVDGPDELLGGPVELVGVELGLGVRDGVESTAVKSAVVALAEVVGLDLLGVAADPLPVDLVEIVGLEHERGHDALSVGRLHHDLDAAEEEVPVRLHGGGHLLGGDVELDTLAGVLQGRAGELEEVARLARGEVDGLGGAESEVIGAGWREMLVIAPNTSAARGGGWWGNLLFSRGWHSVNVWAAARLAMARTAAAEKKLERMLRVDINVNKG